MWAEAMAGKVGLDDYRVMRDDFDLIKIRYQDIFGVGSRSLAVVSRFANIARRGDVRQHADGIGRSLKKAVNGTRAIDREPWLVDFPEATQLYLAVERNTRNDIGHTLVRYDFERGLLVYDDGATENYIEFLVDYLNAVRLTRYLVEVVLLLDHS